MSREGLSRRGSGGGSRSSSARALDPDILMRVSRVVPGDGTGSGWLPWLGDSDVVG